MTYLILILLILQLGDAYTTYVAITSGKGQEANPVFKRLIDAIGLVPAIAFFKLGLSGLAIAMYFNGLLVDDAALYGVGALVIFYFFIVTQNVSVLRGAK